MGESGITLKQSITRSIVVAAFSCLLLSSAFAAEVQGWAIHVAKDSLTREETTGAMLAEAFSGFSSDQLKGLPYVERAKRIASPLFLQAICHEGQPFIKLAKNDRVFDRQATVSYRLDNEPVITETWYGHISKQVLNPAPDRGVFARRIAKANELLIRVPTLDGDRIDAKFLVANNRENLLKLFNLCSPPNSPPPIATVKPSLEFVPNKPSGDLQPLTIPKFVPNKPSGDLQPLAMPNFQRSGIPPGYYFLLFSGDKQGGPSYHDQLVQELRADARMKVFNFYCIAGKDRTVEGDSNVLDREDRMPPVVVPCKNSGVVLMGPVRIEDWESVLNYVMNDLDVIHLYYNKTPRVVR